MYIYIKTRYDAYVILSCLHFTAHLIIILSTYTFISITTMSLKTVIFGDDDVIRNNHHYSNLLTTWKFTIKNQQKYLPVIQFNNCVREKSL